MLQLNHQATERSAPRQAHTFPEMLEKVAGIVRRQSATFAIVIPLVLIAAISYIWLTRPLYTAAASIVVDTRQVQQLNHQQNTPPIEDTVDTGMIETQIELIQSENVGMAVVRQLGLADDPEFTEDRSLIASISRLFSRSAPPSDEIKARVAFSTLEGRLKVKREGVSYVMDLSFVSEDPTKAMRVANAIADAYINDQLDAKYQATKRASTWLQGRLAELRSQSTVALQAVVDFKKANHILDIGPDKRLMSEQQLSDLNGQLVLAQAAIAEARAKLQRITTIMREPIPDESVTDALKSEVIIKLRQQYLDLSQRAALFGQRYGEQHQATLNIRAQMLEVRRAISDEMRKIAESYKSEEQIEEAREMSLRASLSSAVAVSELSNQAQVHLRELESGAASYQTLYDNFLQRYTEAVQQQSFPITEARLISPAFRPLGKSWPKGMLILIASLIFGTALAGAIAYLREASDGVFRTGEQIEETLQLHNLASLAMIEEPSKSRTRGNIGQRISPKLFGSRAPSAAVASGLNNYVVREPFSQFAEGLRSVKVAIDLAGVTHRQQVLGLTSTMPREGKSTIASNLAHLIAHSGARALLIDGDLRNPTLSRLWADRSPGLVDVLTGSKSLQAVIKTNNQSSLSFLSSGTLALTPHTNELLASAGMRAVIEELRGLYDYIIVDLPPLLPVVDTRTTTTFVDSYVYVIEWGRTKIDTVRHCLTAAPEIYRNTLGTVMNKADMATLRRYEHYRGGILTRASLLNTRGSAIAPLEKAAASAGHDLPAAKPSAVNRTMTSQPASGSIRGSDVTVAHVAQHTRLSPTAGAFLDVLRAVSAHAVVFGHTCNVYRFAPSRFATGSVGVIVFFLLSGFLITQSILARMREREAHLPRFLADRCARILTPYVPALAIIAIVTAVVFPIEVGQKGLNRGFVAFVGNLFLLQDYPIFQLSDLAHHALPWRIRPYNTAEPFWTVAIEFWIYVAVGLLFFTAIRREPIRRSWLYAARISVGPGRLWNMVAAAAIA